jgi:RNA polymerase sigma factor (sigma-70 family)
MTMRAQRSMAWEQVLRRHDHRVWLSLLAMGLRPDRARDVAQTTWARLIEKYAADQLQTLELPGLAIAQARFIALDELRRERAENTNLATFLDQMIARSSSSVEAEVISKERLARAGRELSTMSSSAQQVFRLVYGDPPMPQGMVATQLGLSLQRVRQILTEVRKQLRPILEEG